MVRTELKVIIEKPAAEVFAYLADARNESKWDSGLVAIAVEPDGPIALGSKITETRTFLNKKFDSVSEIVEYVPNQHYVRKGTSGNMTLLGTIDVVPVEQGAELRWMMELETSGFFKVAEPVVGAAFKSELTGGLQKLKQAIEG